MLWITFRVTPVLNAQLSIKKLSKEQNEYLHNVEKVYKELFLGLINLVILPYVFKLIFIMC